MTGCEKDVFAEEILSDGKMESSLEGVSLGLLCKLRIIELSASHILFVQNTEL
tara:strand:+ start:518 stop:676 length:159 start_codon:yes stop_codon:yes gene_type:complete